MCVSVVLRSVKFVPSARVRACMRVCSLCESRDESKSRVSSVLSLRASSLSGKRKKQQKKTKSFRWSIEGKEENERVDGLGEREAKERERISCYGRVRLVGMDRSASPSPCSVNCLRSLECQSRPRPLLVLPPRRVTLFALLLSCCSLSPCSPLCCWIFASWNNFRLLWCRPTKWTVAEAAECAITQ